MVQSPPQITPLDAFNKAHIKYHLDNEATTELIFCNHRGRGQGSKVGMELQESDGLVSTENLGVRPWIFESPKLSKIRKTNWFMCSQFGQVNLHSTCFLSRFSYYLSCVLSKKGSAISVSWVVQELPFFYWESDGLLANQNLGVLLTIWELRTHGLPLISSPDSEARVLSSGFEAEWSPNPMLPQSSSAENCGKQLIIL